MKRLFGRISKPSTANLGVESWIASLAATRASRSLLLENSKAPTTPGTSGLTSPESSPKSAPESASLKTSPTIYEWDSEKSGKTFDQWVTALRQGCLQRRKSAQLTRESGYSSWPTATSHDGSNRTVHSTTQGADLAREASRWLTPLSLNQGVTGNIAGQPSGLGVQVRKWSTPRATDGDKGGPNMQFGAGGTPLPSQAAQWRTPDAPTTGGVRTRGKSKGKGHQVVLGEQAESWPTPAARDVKGTNSLLHCEVVGTGRKHMDQLPNFVAHSPQVQAISELGQKSSVTSRKLNPRFVEWLMGWPLGWTDCDSAGMESFHSWQQRHISLSQEP
jgi:hypothetical protein